jgi:hypothetical protein
MEVVEFPPILSDNVVEVGPAIGLAHHHSSRRIVDLNAFEESRTLTPPLLSTNIKCLPRSGRPRRIKDEMLLGLNERAEILLQAGYTAREIIAAGKQSNAAYQKRCESIRDQKWDKFYEFLEDARRTGFPIEEWPSKSAFYR